MAAVLCFNLAAVADGSMVNVVCLAVNAFAAGGSGMLWFVERWR